MTPQEFPEPSARRGLVFGLVLFLLALHLAQAVMSMRLKSLTYDESYYLTAGYSYLKTRDFRMMIDHPPLIPIVSALPLMFLEVNFPADSELWGNLISKYAFGKLFLFGSNNDADAMAFLGRLVMVLLSVLLAIHVFLWAEKLYGTRAGLFALFLYVFSPNVLAFSRLATPDFGITCFLFIACYRFWRYLETPSAMNLVWLGVFSGAALAAKYSAFLLFPIFIFWFATKWLQQEGKLAARSRVPASIQILRPAAIILVMSAAIIFAVHTFRGDALQIYAQGLGSLRLDYFDKGAAGTHFISPDYHYYLNGEFSIQGWWYYCLFAFIVKTPVPTLALLVAALWLWGANKAGVYHSLGLVIPVCLILATSFIDPSNLGLRRILPLYPFLFVFLSQVVGESAKNIFSGENMRRPLLMAFAGWYLAVSMSAFPDYLSFFNKAAGGPEKGLSYLDDSNIDWGQDLKGLKAYMVKHAIPKIKLLYFGTADPDYYGIHWEPVLTSELLEQPQPGYYAISAHIFVRLKLLIMERGGGRNWLEEFTPLARVGHSIYLYKF